MFFLLLASGNTDIKNISSGKCSLSVLGFRNAGKFKKEKKSKKKITSTPEPRNIKMLFLKMVKNTGKSIY